MSDEHNPKVLGCAGHPVIHTPNLDALAERGTRFMSAYTTSPVCIPARAGFACGKYINQIGYWDNADAYDGATPSWHHSLRESGHRVPRRGADMTAFDPKRTRGAAFSPHPPTVRIGFRAATEVIAADRSRYSTKSPATRPMAPASWMWKSETPSPSMSPAMVVTVPSET